jgi:hypothetical protein
MRKPLLMKDNGPGNLGDAARLSLAYFHGSWFTVAVYAEHIVEILTSALLTP